METDFLQKEITIQTLGENIKKQRIASALTQAQLAQKAGVSKRTVERIENGASIQLSNFLAILRTLGILHNLELLFPNVEVTPYQYIERQNQKKPAERVRSRQHGDTTPFKWGDET